MWFSWNHTHPWETKTSAHELLDFNIWGRKKKAYLDMTSLISAIYDKSGIETSLAIESRILLIYTFQGGSWGDYYCIKDVYRVKLSNSELTLTSDKTNKKSHLNLDVSQQKMMRSTLDEC